MFFTIEELSIIKMYHTKEMTKEEIISIIEDAAAYVDDDSISKTMISVVNKLSKITLSDFVQLDLSDVLEATEL